MAEQIHPELSVMFFFLKAVYFSSGPQSYPIKVMHGSFTENDDKYGNGYKIIGYKNSIQEDFDLKF